MAALRVCPTHPNVGTVPYVLQTAHRSIEFNNHAFGHAMNMLEPSLQLLTKAKTRTETTLARLHSLPKYITDEMSKQMAITKLGTQKAALQAMVDSLIQVNGLLHHVLRREFTDIVDNYMNRQADEPFQVSATTEETDFYVVTDAVYSPWLDDNDQATWVPYGWVVKDKKKWVDWSAAATQGDHGLAKAGPGSPPQPQPSAAAAEAEAQPCPSQSSAGSDAGQSWTRYDNARTDELIAKGQSPFGGAGSEAVHPVANYGEKHVKAESPFGSSS